MLSRDDLVVVESIFDEVVDLDEVARMALLDERCAQRPELRAEVETLLNAHARVGGFMEPMDPVTVARSGGSADAEPRAGNNVGPWRLVRRIGAGGMGDVYLAERADGAFAGSAAVKFTRAHLPDPVAARRFVAERQFLASLHHPNIVTLLDGGATPAGEGYLVMEYVEGTPLTEFCRARSLSLDARLALVRQVCSAVQYAHQRAIVHRDLKPGNILVTADGIPKILDFGVAKLLEGTGADETMTVGMLPGPLTPNYASPEQLRGLPVTTAADVYSLGVLLYEVATGERPYETAGQTLDAVVRIVVDTEPSRPSAPRSGTTKSGAQPTLPYPRHELRGDLDAIVLKAMRKEPEQRYGSAGELADDLGRFLAKEPVIAREPSLGYTLRRLAARNKALVGVTAAAVVAILAALGIALWQRQVAVRAQERAETRFREVRQLANSLIFDIHDRVAKLPGSTPVRREIVDEALTYLERLGRDAAGDAELQLELAGAYRQIGSILGDAGRPNLGDREGARKQLERSRHLLLPLVAGAAPSHDVLTSIVTTERVLSGVLKRLDRDEEAMTIATAAVAHAEQAAKAHHPDAKELLARATFQQAMALHPTEAAIPYWRRTEKQYIALLDERPDDASRQRSLGLVDKYLGSILERFSVDETAFHYGRALELDERRLARAPDDRVAQFDTAISLSNVASVSYKRGDKDKALALFTRSLGLRLALSSSDPEDVLARGRVAWVRMRLAHLEKERGNMAAALEHAELSVRDQQLVVDKSKDTGSGGELAESLMVLGDIQRTLGRVPAACHAFTRAVPLYEADNHDVNHAGRDEAKKTIAEHCGK